MTKRICLTGVFFLLFAHFAGAEGDGPDERAFRQAAAEPDAPRRAEAVRPFLDIPPHYCAVCDVWVKCGKAALPVLRQLLADELRPDHYSFLAILIQAGGKDAVPDLERLLEDEKVYWHNLGMNLDEEQKVSRPRFEFLVAILTHLHEFGYRDEQGLVQAVRDGFRDHPLLCDYGKIGGVSPVVQAAEAILLRQ